LLFLKVIGAAIVINCLGRQNTLATPLVVPWKKNKNNKEERNEEGNKESRDIKIIFSPELAVLAFS
jgi:hypothetical protein